MNSNEVNFVSAKKRTQFKVKNQLDPFIYNSREAGQEEDPILQQSEFPKQFHVEI